MSILIEPTSPKIGESEMRNMVIALVSDMQAYLDDDRQGIYTEAFHLTELRDSQLYVIERTYV